MFESKSIRDQLAASFSAAENEKQSAAAKMFADSLVPNPQPGPAPKTNDGINEQIRLVAKPPADELPPLTSISSIPEAVDYAKEFIRSNYEAMRWTAFFTRFDLITPTFRNISSIHEAVDDTIAYASKKHIKLSSVHLIAHGPGDFLRAGYISLGDDRVDLTDAKVARELHRLKPYLAKGAVFEFNSCSLASGFEVGLQQLANRSGIPIRAYYELQPAVEPPRGPSVTKFPQK